MIHPPLPLSLWCKACLSFAITFPLGPGLASPVVLNTYTAVASSRSGLSHESCRVLGGRHDSVGCRESGRTRREMVARVHRGFSLRDP